MNTKVKEWKLCSHDDEGMARRHQQARNDNPFTAGAELLEEWARGRNPDTTPLQRHATEPSAAAVPLCGEIKGPQPRDTRPSQAGAIQ